MPEVLEVTDETFETEIAKAGKPAILDFWAEWCAPCRAISPIVKGLAEAYGEDVVIAKMNIDENPDTPTKFSVRGIPTLLLFKNGAVVSQKVGAAAKSQLSAWIDSNT